MFNSDNSLVVRTDYSDEKAWKELRLAIERPVGDQAYVEYLEDPELSNLSAEQIQLFLPKSFDHSAIFIVDRESLSHPDCPILVVDLFEQPGRKFRVVPSEMWAVENNLAIANMDFSEFADNVDEDGIFRGFKE